MKHRGVLFLLMTLAAVPTLVQAQDLCSDNNGSNPAYTGSFAANGHISGSHSFAGAATEACSYSSPATDCFQYCATTATTTMYVGATDTGILVTLLGYHVSRYSITNGSAFGNAGGTHSSGVSAVAWEACLTSTCVFSVLSNPISFPASPVFTGSQTAATDCGNAPNPDYSPEDPSCGGGGRCPPNCNGSPIIVDTSGKGFRLNFCSRWRDVRYFRRRTTG